jgi:hypothetical protein
MMGGLLALPLIALHVYVDRNPSWPAILGLHLAYGVIVAVPTVSEGLFWAQDADWGNNQEDHVVWLQALGLTALLAWLTAILPFLFTPPSVSPMPGAVDGAIRMSWLVLCVAGTLGLRQAPPLPEAWRNRAREAFALLLLLAGVWPLSEGLARVWSGAVLLGAVSLIAVVAGRWQQQQACLARHQNVPSERRGDR